MCYMRVTAIGNNEVCAESDISIRTCDIEGSEDLPFYTCVSYAVS